MADLTEAADFAKQEFMRCQSDAVSGIKEYETLCNWADMFAQGSFNAKKMIASQFVKSVHIRRDYKLTIEFNVTPNSFRFLNICYETVGDKRSSLALKEKIADLLNASLLLKWGD